MGQKWKNQESFIKKLTRKRFLLAFDTIESRQNARVHLAVAEWNIEGTAAKKDGGLLGSKTTMAAVGP